MKTKFFFAVTLIAGTFALAQAHADGLAAVRVQSTATIMMDSNLNPDETVLYTCDTLAQQTEDLLKSAGATNIKVDCSGNGGWTDLSYSPTVTATFDSAHLPKPGLLGAAIMATWQPVSLRDSEGCSTMAQLVNGVARSLELRNVNMQSCYLDSDQYHFTFDSLVEK